MKKENHLFLRLSLTALIALFGTIIYNEATTNHIEKGCMISYALDKLGRHDESINHILRVLNKETSTNGIKAEYKTDDIYSTYTAPATVIKDKSGKVLSYTAPSGGVLTGSNYTITTVTRDSYIEVTKDNELVKQIRR